MTKLGTISYSLVLAGPVTGLSKSDFTRTGNAAGCSLSSPVKAGAADGSEYTLGFTGCGTGTVGICLNAGQVVGADAVAGPAGPIAAAKVTIDASKPKVPKPSPNLRAGVALEGPSTTQRLLMTLRWSGTDTSSGIASYDGQRSYDGAAFETSASATTATSLNWMMTPGHAIASGFAPVTTPATSAPGRRTTPGIRS